MKELQRCSSDLFDSYLHIGKLKKIIDEKLEELRELKEQFLQQSIIIVELAKQKLELITRNKELERENKRLKTDAVK